MKSGQLEQNTSKAKTDEKEEQALKEITESGRWWDCRMDFNSEWTFEGGLKCKEQAPPGTEPVINQERMLVREKVDSQSI